MPEISLISLLVLLNLLVFGRTIWYDIVIDDNCRKFHTKDLHKNIFVRLYRNTKYSGHGGLPLKLEHSFTILIHTAVCIAIYLCFGKTPQSFIAALLFAVHPANNQVSVWMNGKRFGVTALLIVLAYGLKPYGIVFYILSPIWHASGLPALLLFHEYGWVWLLLIVPLLFYKKIINKIGSRWERIPYGEIKVIHPKKVIILIKMLGYHFCHCLLPRDMSFYHMFMERLGFSEEDNKKVYAFNKDFWVGLIVVLSLGMAMTLYWGTPIGLGLFWWVIFIVMWCQFPIGLTQAIAGRNYYLPNVGLCLALSHILPYELIIMLFTYYLTKLWFYMPAYKNLEEFYRYALFAFPNHFRARAHVIQRELQEGKVFWALRDCGIGLRHTPKDCTLNLLMAQSLMAVGAWGKAKEYLGKAKGCMVLGQEEHFTNVISMFNGLIDKQMSGQGVGKRLGPNEVIEIKASQISSGR